ncbi:MAG: glycosyl hydrolase family 28 protein [Anaerolineae bacterium]|nr:glycosyl hydrolase family 28 protein [Anaerolineae bacterium]
MSAKSDSTTIPPFNGVMPQSNLYRVYINGHPCPVYDTPIFFELNNQDRKVAFSHFDFTEPVRVVVESLREVDTVRIRPTSRAVRYRLRDSLISFTLDEPAKLSIEINGGIDDNLHIFAGRPEVAIPSPEDPDVLFYGPGMHYVDNEYGFLRLESNQTLYLAAGAVLNARIVADDANNIRIGGRGILLGSTLLGRQPHYYREFLGEPADLKRPRFVVFKNCQDIIVEGVFMNDTPAWALVFDSCTRVNVSNIKQFGYVDNCDAIDIVSCQDVLIEDVFLRANDDCVVIKSNGSDVDNVVVRDSVMWSDRAQALQIGHELVSDKISNVVFRNIDVLEQRNRYVGHFAIGVYNGGNAVVSDILFEDIRVENHFRLIGLIVDKGFYGRTEERGQIENMIFRNIDSLTTMDIHITGWDEEHGVKNITFEDLTVRGKPCEPEIYHNLYVHDLKFMNNGETVKEITHFIPSSTEFLPIDIGPICNRSRIDTMAGDGKGWLDLGPERDLHELDGGIHTFSGVPFHIAENRELGVVILRSSQHLIDQPYWSYPLNINRCIDYLFFLQGTAFTNVNVDKIPPEVWIGKAGKLRFNQSDTGVPLWYYRVRYADNTELKVPVKAGWHVEDWEIWAPGGWVVRMFGKKFYIQQWENPKRGIPVSYIKVESALAPEVPIVLGVTAAVVTALNTSEVNIANE